MIRYHYILLFLFCFVNSKTIKCQFLGGFKDGYHNAQYVNTVSINLGNNSDGYTNYYLKNATSIFTGNFKDGYVNSHWTNPNTIFGGGNKDGVNSFLKINQEQIFKGGIKDGWNQNFIKSDLNIYSGGSDDGFAVSSKILSYFWIGVVNENWNNTGNWATGIIPNIASNVVIPSDVPHYPFLIGGTMNVGQDPDGGDYLCKRIFIRKDAQVQLNSVAILKNYGTIQVNGSIKSFNTQNGSIVNKLGGNFTINQYGLVEIKE